MSTIHLQRFLCWIRTVQRNQQEIQTVQQDHQDIRNRVILYDEERKRLNQSLLQNWMTLKKASQGKLFTM